MKINKKTLILVKKRQAGGRKKNIANLFRSIICQ